jgi:carbon-monoxide dehydrogenase small subunit
MNQHIDITVNGERLEMDVAPGTLLSDLLRDQLHLTGTKRGCETGVCGACTVMVDGRAVKSCLQLAVQARGLQVTTVEGLGHDGRLHPLQEAFMAHGGLQCGYCTPGFLMSACALLCTNPDPTHEELCVGLSGNLCRCTGYAGIVDSVRSAAEKLRGA